VLYRNHLRKSEGPTKKRYAQARKIAYQFFRGGEGFFSRQEIPKPLAALTSGRPTAMPDGDGVPRPFFFWPEIVAGLL